MNQQAIAEMVELGEAEAYADLFAAAPPEMGLRVERIGSTCVLIAPHLPTVLFNRVLGLGLREPASEDTVDAILALYRQAGSSVFAIQVSPIASPPELVDWLAVRSLTRRDNWAKVYRRSDSQIVIATDLRIETIGVSDAPDYARVVCAAFGMPDQLRPWIESGVGRPGWLHYLGFDGERPVAAAALFMRDGVGWLGVGCTLPSHRRRGAQGALMAQRIRDAAANGCEWVITETGEDVPEYPNPSFHNMVRTGFVLAYQRPNFIWEDMQAAR
jgi:hypothetical protein